MQAVGSQVAQACILVINASRLHTGMRTCARGTCQRDLSSCEKGFARLLISSLSPPCPPPSSFPPLHPPLPRVPWSPLTKHSAGRGGFRFLRLAALRSSPALPIGHLGCSAVAPSPLPRPGDSDGQQPRPPAGGAGQRSAGGHGKVQQEGADGGEQAWVTLAWGKRGLPSKHLTTIACVIDVQG